MTTRPASVVDDTRESTLAKAGVRAGSAVDTHDQLYVHSGRNIHLLVFTSLYPNSAQPGHGVFIEERLRHLVDSGRIAATVVAPVPWFPFRHRAFGTYATFAAVPKKEMRRIAVLSESMAMRGEPAALGYLVKPSEKKPKSEWKWVPCIPNVDELRKKWFTQMHVGEGGHMRTCLTDVRAAPERGVLDLDVGGLRSVGQGVHHLRCFCEEVGKVGRAAAYDDGITQGQRRVAVDIMGPFPLSSQGDAFVHCGKFSAPVKTANRDLWKIANAAE